MYGFAKHILPLSILLRGLMYMLWSGRVRECRVIEKCYEDDSRVTRFIPIKPVFANEQIFQAFCVNFAQRRELNRSP